MNATSFKPAYPTICACLLLLLFTGCKEKYDPVYPLPETGYLVVEGFINVKGSTRIKLTRSNKLEDRQIIPVAGASLRIEGENNSIYPLKEDSSGYYSSQYEGELNPNTKYRLFIKSPDNKEYVSAFRDPILTPVIDSISWAREKENGVQLYINAHDDDDQKTLYYKWEYVETWEFRSAYRKSLKKIVNTTSGTPRVIVEDSDIMPYDTTEFTCWKTRPSTSIVISNTAKLAEDIVYFPLVYFPRGAWELSQLYHIKVKQIGISAEAYAFYEKLKKNTESLGTVFDPQPSEINGNITCTSHPDQLAIGFVDVTTEVEKELYIDNKDLEGWLHHDGCPPELYSLDPDVNAIALLAFEGYEPTSKVNDDFGSDRFKLAPGICVKCTLRGVNQRPSFWPR